MELNVVHGGAPTTKYGSCSCSAWMYSSWFFTLTKSYGLPDSLSNLMSAATPGFRWNFGAMAVKLRGLKSSLNATNARSTSSPTRDLFGSGSPTTSGLFAATDGETGSPTLVAGSCPPAAGEAGLPSLTFVFLDGESGASSTPRLTPRGVRTSMGSLISGGSAGPCSSGLMAASSCGSWPPAGAAAGASAAWDGDC